MRTDNAAGRLCPAPVLVSASMTLSSWLDLPSPAPTPLRGDLRCDVLVVGGGLCAAGAILALTEAGVDAALLESGRLSGGATGRNAGFILQGTAERYSRAVAVYGRERTRLIHALSLENHQRMADTIAALGIAAGYRRGGSLQLASSEIEEHELVESAKLLVEDGFQAELLRGEALDAVYREAGFHVGVLLPMDGEVHPVRFARGVFEAAAARGARIYEQSPVLELDAREAGAVRARTPEGSLSAQVALVCTNARVGELLPWYADKVDAVRGQMLATAPAPRIFALPVYADHGFDYWRQDALGRVVLGGWRNLDPEAERGAEDCLHPEIQARMDAFLARFPALAGIPVTHRWSGTMGFSRDGLPLVGLAPGSPGALAAAGFTGHGFGFAFLAGEALAATALEGRHPLVDAFSPRRFL